MKSISPSGSQKSSKPTENASAGVTSIAIAAAVVALLTTLAFLPALRNQFVNWDDYETLVNNSSYRGLSWPRLRWMFTTFHLGHFQPLSWVSFAIDYLVWGTNPLGYHLTNLILHAANAVLFFLLARLFLSMAIKGSGNARQLGLTVGAGVAALLFSVHPLRVESVAWATERRDVLSGFFYLVALYHYVIAQTGAKARWSGRRLAVSVLLYTLSLFSKATAMTLPAVLLLLDVYPLRRLPGKVSQWVKPEYRSILWEKLPFVALAVVFAWIAILAQQDTGALRPMQQYFISYRLGQAFYAFCFYVWKSVAPFKLSPLYELPYDFDAWMPLFVLCAAAVLTITVVLYWRRERWPAVFAAWAYYVIVLAPVAGIAQSGPQMVADRYSYLSCLSWALLLGGGFVCFWNSLGGGRARQGLAFGGFAASSLLLMTLGAMTWQQNKVWRDTHTLWQHVIAAAPNSSIAYYNLGRLYEDEGQLDISQQHYQRAVQNNPANPDAQYNLARLLARRGMEAEAIDRYRQVIDIRPYDADARNNLGLLLARRGEAEAALEEFRKAIKINPNYAKAFFNMGKVLAAQGDLEKAIFNYHQALKLNPSEIEVLLGLANALARQGQSEEALLVLQKVVVLQPHSPDGHTALARALALQGRTAEAEKHYQEALQLLKSQATASPDRGTRP